ncbi:sensor histidine kinase [Methanococcoides sp. FTZ1]|uniref:sensor histidine kinase n=1 Tax=Methanococcoides sp. FTZ1 TaxID=3439061 RepID=UPI003F84834D
MESKNISLKNKILIYVILGTFLVLSVSGMVSISTVTAQQEEMAYQQSIELTREYANYFDGNTRANRGIVKTISTTMSNYEAADRDEVNAMLKGILLENPQLVGVYVGYEPNAFDGKDAEFTGKEGHDETGRFVPYWNTINGPISVEPLVDYETSEYYQGPKQLKQSVVTEPYLYQGILMVSYDSPIIRDGEFVGISGVDVSLNYFDEVVSDVSVFDTGYAFVTSNSGKLLTHPEHKEWIGIRNLDDFGVSEISEMAVDISDGKGGYIETIDPVTGREVVMFYEPIAGGSYSFVLCAPKDEMLAGVTVLRERLLSMSLFSVVLVGGVAYMVARSTDNSIKKMLYDFKLISDKALVGNFDTRADTNVQVDFKKIPQALNQILDNMGRLTKENEKAMDAMLHAKIKAENADRTKTEFLSNMSHELRTPLTLIIGFSKVLDSENFGSLNEHQKKYTSDVIRNANHLLELISDLMDFSKIEIGTMELHINEFVVAEAIDEVEELVKPLASEKSIELISNVEIETPSINADRIKFKQILYNLMSNAIKFTHKGGSVTIGGKISDESLQMFVKDTGIGISSEDKDRLFNPFYQVDGSSTREYGGTGLGLTLVRKFVEMHGGDVWVESEVGKGSTFTFTILAVQMVDEE